MDLRSRFTALLCAALFFAPTAKAVDFNGTGVGAIPDNSPTGLTISFNSAAFAQQVGDVRLQLTMTHSYARDLKATLKSPSGVAQLLIFGRTGLRTTAGGGAANLAGTYTFSDVGKDWWATVAPLVDGATVPPGNYRTSVGGAGSPTVGTNNAGGCFSSLGGAFFGLAAADAAGTWTLTIADLQATDTGAVTAAVLSLLPLPDLVSRNGFEVAPRGTCKPSSLDFTGVGRSSYVLVRNTGGGPTGAITWFIKENDLAGVGAESNFLLGNASDFFVSGDWDGDGITDAGVWRPGAVGQFIIRLSSRPTRLFTMPFGQTGDDSSIVDDFNGDGLTDFAVYRSGASAGLVSQTLIRLSSSFVDRTYTTGLNGHFPMSGDFNGDGAADIGTQFNSGSGNASFQLYNGLSGTTMGSPIVFGTPTDVIVDGNFFGNAFDDITVVRGVSGNYFWSTLDISTPPAPPIPPASIVPTTTATLGLSSSDFVLYGDYDGDSLDDYATWRPSATPGQSKFIVRRSSVPAATPIEVFFGANGDYPIGNTRRH